MSDLILVYEPDSAADTRTYGEALAPAFPGHAIVATANRAEALARAPETTVLIAKAQDISAELLGTMPRLGWIQALTTGIDPLLALNLPSSIIVTSARGIHGPQMAELTLLLMMALSRNFPQMLANQREAKWERWGQRLLVGKTVVIVGVGAISEALAARCKPFGLKVIGITNRRVAEHFDELHPRQRLHEAASRADFLVLLVPYSPETHHLIDASVLAAMKPTAHLINVSRGSVVDEAALIAALQSRRIAGAGLDVFAQEPLPPGSPFWALDHVIVTPHVGGMSDVYAEQIVPLLVHNIRAYLAGNSAAMLNRVYFED
jgi:D-2-hydroxyacid dehydrogenase (NADP+)